MEGVGRRALYFSMISQHRPGVGCVGVLPNRTHVAPFSRGPYVRYVCPVIHPQSAVHLPQTSHTVSKTGPALETDVQLTFGGQAVLQAHDCLVDGGHSGVQHGSHPSSQQALEGIHRTVTSP